MKILSALLVHREGNPPLTGGFLLQRPVTRSFGVFFDVRLNKRLNKNRGPVDLRRHDVHVTSLYDTEIKKY